MSAARIVLVDDNVADVKLLKMALDEKRKNYELKVLQTGEAALDFVKNYSKGDTGDTRSPCVILLDLNLPGYDGFAVLKAIKGAPELSHVKVVVLSGLASPEQRAKIREMGALYIEKPMELSDYFNLGARVLELCEDVMTAGQL
jgi:DNA-binding response OmpR family regulator